MFQFSPKNWKELEWTLGHGFENVTFCSGLGKLGTYIYIWLDYILWLLNAHLVIFIPQIGPVLPKVKDHCVIVEELQ